MINEGLNLMIFGMGTVFLFLTLLVFATTLMTAVVNRFFPAPIETESVANSSLDQNQNRLVAVIEAAVKQHRSNK